MANHVLSLEVPDTLNTCILRVADTSIYQPLSPPSCMLLEVTVPGFNIPVQFTEANISLGFNLNLTTCDLNMQTTGCGTSYNSLPDGIYILRYSVSPNDIVYVEYNHLRITQSLLKIQAILCDLDLGICDPPENIKSKLNKLNLIRSYLYAAKAKVEYCHNPEKGINLYKYANKLLSKMTCSTCH